MSRYVTYSSWIPSTGISLIPNLTSTIIPTSAISDEIIRSEAFVDSYAGRNWSPSDYATAPMITMITEDITTYRLYKNYLYNNPEGMAAGINTDLIDNRFNIAVATLEQLRDGAIELMDSSGNLIAKSDLDNKIYINTVGYSPTTNEDSPLDWCVSPNKLDDIFDARDDDRG
jgi:phage gp36-like protein